MMYKLKKNIASKPKWFKKPLLIALIVLGVAGLTLGGLEYTDTTYLFHDRPTTHETQKNTPTRTAGQNTKGEGSENSSQSSADQEQAGDEGTYSPGSEDKTPADTTQNDANLITPSGNFVNTHKMGVNSAANTQQSVCVTTEGATCEIYFTKGSVTKSLGVQTTDRGGAAYWTWSPQSAGLSVGTWKITAKAVLGSQTKTANDTINLEVTP